MGKVVRKCIKDDTNRFLAQCVWGEARKAECVHFMRTMEEAINQMILDTAAMPGLNLLHRGKLQCFVGDIVFFIRKHIRKIQAVREDMKLLGLSSSTGFQKGTWEDRKKEKPPSLPQVPKPAKAKREGQDEPAQGPGKRQRRLKILRVRRLI